MKSITKKILYWLNFSIIFLMLILAVSLSGLYFASAYFSEYNHSIEQFVSKTVQHPVQIGKITIGNRGLEPVFRLHDIVIFNKTKTKKLLKARELQVGIDLVGSLFTWQIKPGLLLIRGSELTIYQDKSKKVIVAGVSRISSATDNDISMINEVSSWLFEQSRIDLEDIILNWHLTGGKVIKFTALYLKLHNEALQHTLKIGGNFEQQKFPAVFEANLNLRGDILKQSSFPLNGDIAIKNWVQEFDDFNSPQNQNNFFVPSGDINFSVKHSKIAVKLFRQPITINNMSGKITWQRDSNGLEVNINKLIFTDDWLTFFGDGRFSFLNDSKTPTVDVRLGIKLNNLAKAKLYYPVNLMPPKAVVWLDQAFVSSKLISGNIILQGPLDKFPFDHGEGKFLVDTIIRDVCLNYDPSWPRVNNITGKMVFEGRSMTITSRNATIMNEPVKSITAIIPDLDLPIIQIIGAMDTDSSIGLKFVNASPLKYTIGKKLKDISLMGPMKFRLSFDMPLSDYIADQNTKIEGTIGLYNNHLHPNDWDFSIENLSGNIHFGSNNFVANDLKGKLFNKPINVTISNLNPSHKDVITRVNLTGSANVLDFEQAFSIKLTPYTQGGFDYKAMLDLHSNATRNVFKLNSNLRGVEIKLPDPFDKKANNPGVFNLTGYFGGNESPQIIIDYNNQINASLIVKKSGDKELQILGGEIRVGVKPAPAKISSTLGQGLVVTGNLEKLDWPIWKDYFAISQTGFTKTSSIIKRINLNVFELHALGRIFKKILLGIEPKESGWEVAFLTSDAEGKIIFPNDDKTTVKGEFKKIYFAEEHQKLPTLKPQKLPPLNFKIDDLRYGSKYFNRAVFITEPQPGGIKINKITFGGSKFNIEGSGEWLTDGNNENSVFRGKISSSDVGGLLKQWDLISNMVAGKGEAVFILKWPSSFYKPTIQTVNGNFSINVTDGRIINLSKQTENKLGLGKILNILSLQSLPRRLSLDFSDLTQKGFAFDTMAGSFEFASGNVIIKRLNLDGAIAHVEASGNIGLKTHSYDIRFGVVPHISTAIPVATTAAIFGGPVVGVVGLIADNILSNVTKKATEKAINYNYHVTGTWEHPDITKN